MNGKGLLLIALLIVSATLAHARAWDAAATKRTESALLALGKTNVYLQETWIHISDGGRYVTAHRDNELPPVAESIVLADGTVKLVAPGKTPTVVPFESRACTAALIALLKIGLLPNVSNPMRLWETRGNVFVSVYWAWSNAMTGEYFYPCSVGLPLVRMDKQCRVIDAGDSYEVRGRYFTPLLEEERRTHPRRTHRRN